MDEHRQFQLPSDAYQPIPIKFKIKAFLHFFPVENSLLAQNVAGFCVAGFKANMMCIGQY